MNKTLATILLAGGLVLVNYPAQAITVINFNNTAPADYITSYGQNGSYTESGFTISAGTDSILYANDPNWYIGDPSVNGTDYIYIQAPGWVSNASGTLRSTSPFSIQGFDAANLFFGTGADLTLTGHKTGGGTLTQTFKTLNGNQWSAFYLTGWSDLTSIDIYSTGGALSFDNIVVNASDAGGAPVSEPSTLLALCSAYMGFVALRRRTKSYASHRNSCRASALGLHERMKHSI